MQPAEVVLTPDAVKVFDAVAGSGEVGADDLPARTRLSRDRVHAVIPDLVQSGLVSVLRSGDGHLTIRLDTHRAVHSLVSRGVEAQHAGALDLLRARSALGSMLDGSADAGVGAEKVTDVVALQHRLEDLAASLQREVLILAAGTMPSKEELDDARGRDLSLLRRGVTMLFVYPYEVGQTPYLREYAADLVAAGAKSRVADDVPCRMWIFDRKSAVVPIDGRTARHGAYIVTGGPFVQGLRHWAMTLWRHGRSVENVVDDPVEAPSPLERRVLLLMSSGVTDEVGARQLGVTDRTFRRYVAVLLERLGAKSRFQAGVKAVERGWL